MVDFSKFDFAKFDTKKLFDADTVLNNIDRTNTAVIDMITDKKVKTVAEGLHTAGLSLARAQVLALRDYNDAVKKAFAI